MVGFTLLHLGCGMWVIKVRCWFVLATNILDEKFLSNDEMLSEYKAQQSCKILPLLCIPVAKFHARYV